MRKLLIVMLCFGISLNAFTENPEGGDSETCDKYFVSHHGMGLPVPIKRKKPDENVGMPPALMWSAIALLGGAGALASYLAHTTYPETTPGLAAAKLAAAEKALPETPIESEIERRMIRLRNEMYEARLSNDTDEFIRAFEEIEELEKEGIK